MSTNKEYNGIPGRKPTIPIPDKPIYLMPREYAVALGFTKGLTTLELSRQHEVHRDTIASQRTIIYGKMRRACKELADDYIPGDQRRVYEYSTLLVMWFNLGYIQERRNRKLFSSPQ